MARESRDTMNVQACEVCGSRETQLEDDDLYGLARPGSRADADGHEFERMCASCATILKLVRLRLGGRRS